MGDFAALLVPNAVQDTVSLSNGLHAVYRGKRVAMRMLGGAMHMLCLYQLHALALDARWLILMYSHVL